MFLIFVGLCILILIIEAPGLIRQKHYKEFYALAILLLIGFSMGLAFFLKWPLTAPFDAVIAYFGG
ncbi:MAG: hypothetical protein H6Q64_1774 [Firmicutes bacterium]|nr:hypothetical protein [Bacillota bacterium]